MRLLIIQTGRLDHRPRLHRHRRAKSQQYPSCVFAARQGKRQCSRFDLHRCYYVLFDLLCPARQQCGARSGTMSCACLPSRHKYNLSSNAPLRSIPADRVSLQTRGMPDRELQEDYAYELVSYMPLAHFLAVDKKGARCALDTQAQRLGHATALQTTRPAAPFAQRTPRGHR